MNSRRSNNPMANFEHRIDLTSGEENHSNEQENQNQQTPITMNNELNNDHLHQFINLLKENLTSTFPFALILILKAFYEHSAGILMVIFFSASIYHANSVLVQQAALKSNRKVWSIMRVLLILTASLITFLYLFRQDKFYLCLIFLGPSFDNWDLWTLIWVIYSTFCIVKMLVMIFKGLLILISLNSYLTYRKRGCYFSIIEHLSQFYLSLLTIRPWIYFLINNRQSNLIFSTFLIVFYSIIKFYHLFKTIKELRRYLSQSFQSLPFPLISVNELRETICPICQSEYQHPILLTCKHIFCEECISSWLDRNATCPLCRCKLPIGQSTYRDGFTSGYLIWY